VGRPFHWITATHGPEVRVHKLSRDQVDDYTTIELESTQVLGGGTMTTTNPNQMFRCWWNVTGTVLASSGAGGMVQLWKSDFQGQWKCVSQIHGDLTQTAAAVNIKVY
jgi:nucleoporin SEH1